MVNAGTLQGTIPQQGTFEDDFPTVGYISSLEGKYSIHGAFGLQKKTANQNPKIFALWKG